MSSHIFGRFALAAAVVLATAPAARADIRDYEFRLVATRLAVGDAVVTVRLVHVPSGKPVPDAVVFARRLDMAPDNMASMTAPIEPIAADEPGLYGFKTDLTMAGRWRLSLAAKIQGETGTLTSRLMFEAAP